MLCGWFLLAGAPVLCAQSYIVKDLGTLGGSLGSAADAINSSGQVVGYAFTTNNAGLHATLFSGTGSNNTDLGGLAGAANNNGEAYGINDSGQILGHATAPGGNVHATLFSGTGSVTLISVRWAGYSVSAAQSTMRDKWLARQTLALDTQCFSAARVQGIPISGAWAEE